MLALLNSRYVVWVALALPGAWLTARYATGVTFYGEYLHSTGELAAQLLILALAVTPLRLWLPKVAWVAWLGARRRYVGVAACGYTLLHAGAYLVRQPLERVISDGAELAMATGWVALIVMLVLAATSNDASVRRLGARWKRLHRTVYVAAALTFAHWLLAAFDPVAGAVHLGVLVALVALRLLRRPTRSA